MDGSITSRRPGQSLLTLEQLVAQNCICTAPFLLESLTSMAVWEIYADAICRLSAQLAISAVDVMWPPFIVSRMGTQYIWHHRGSSVIICGDGNVSP